MEEGEDIQQLLPANEVLVNWALSMVTLYTGTNVEPLLAWHQTEWLDMYLTCLVYKVCIGDVACSVVQVCA